MTLQILKRLTYCLIISLLVSLTYVWSRHNRGIGEMDADGMHEYYILLFLNIGVCTLSFILSLTSLINLKLTVRQNYLASFSSFMALPTILLLMIIALFLYGRHKNDYILSFFDLGLSSLTFCVVLFFQYYRFNKTTGINK